MLCLLVSRHGHLIQKDVLLQTVWADAIVEEGNVAHAIAELRRALGETGRRALIETVPGHGYRFVGEVTVDAGAPPPASSTAEAVGGWAARLARAAVLEGAGGAPVPAHGAIVGRDAELEALRAGFESACAGRGVMLCLAGEAGIGKSALIERFLAERDRGACLVAAGRCSELLPGSEAYLPVLEALDGLLQNEPAAADLLKLVAPTWYVQVQPLWHAADPSFAPIAAEARAASKERMKRELAAFIQELSAAGPLILVVDDLHWADPSTAELLGYLGRKLETLSVLAVAAYRHAELQLTRHPFIAVRQELQRQGVCREMALGFLTPEDVWQLPVAGAARVRAARGVRRVPAPQDGRQGRRAWGARPQEGASSCPVVLP